MQVGEGGLAVLVLHQSVVGLNTLQPAAETETVASAGIRELIGDGEEIADRVQIAASIGAAIGDLRSTVSVVPPPTTTAPTGWPE